MSSDPVGNLLGMLAVCVFVPMAAVAVSQLYFEVAAFAMASAAFCVSLSQVE